MRKFKAFKIYQEGERVGGRLEELDIKALGQGDVLIRAAYSSVNYKDALAATGKGKIIRKFPRIGGIDVSGYVAESSDRRFREGDPVIVTGYDLGVAHDGGYAEYVRVPADWVIPLPPGMSLFQAMAVGTAGFTVALCVQQLEDNRQRPDIGPFAITGATGGVGNLAIDIMSSLGYEPVAVTGKPDHHDKLKALGAAQVIDRRDIAFSDLPLEKARFGGAIDNVGGDILSWLLKTIKPHGNVVSVGLAGGSHLETSVMPFILRGVSLLGVTSSGCRADYRRVLWERLASDLAPQKLDKIVTDTIDLSGLESVFHSMLAGRTSGRTVVKINPGLK